MEGWEEERVWSERKVNITPATASYIFILNAVSPLRSKRCFSSDGTTYSGEWKGDLKDGYGTTTMKVNTILRRLVITLSVPV